MIAGDALRALLPHAGAMCLLDSVSDWSMETITCVASSHLSHDNPLRRAGQLATLCGAEYGLQAAAIHGALRDGGKAQPAGYLSGLTLSHIGVSRLDDPAVGRLTVAARLELADRRGLIYGFSLSADDGLLLLEGRGTILFAKEE